jgi:transposase
MFDAAWRAGLKNPEEVMEILEAFDLTGTLRGAAELAGCDHKTVAHWVRAREQAGGGLPVAVRPRPRVDAFAVKIEEWVDRSRGRIRADVAHQRLLAMGYLGSERTTRRAVAQAKRRWRAEHGRRFRPWVTEPGLWMQWDHGDGPLVAGRSTVLFCAWLAWSRFRVIVPLWDRRMPSVVMGLDRALRAFGGAPTYALTDNERTVSVDHICGLAIRNQQIVSVGRHYGLTIATCVPADPESKGGSEATVRIARADLVPTEHNLRSEYAGFGQLEAACAELGDRVNTREHRITRRAPAVMLAEERARLHPLPQAPHTVCFGQTRKVSWQSTISVGGAFYSVPSALVDERVWVRSDGEELVIVHADSPDGPREVARHALTTPGRPSIQEEHYPPRPPGALERRPKAGTLEEQAFLAIGPGAAEWLTKAAAVGAVRLRRKIAEAVALAKLHGPGDVDEALAAAAAAGRFGEGDLAAILAHRGAKVIEFPARASEQQSLQRSTRSWDGFGA